MWDELRSPSAGKLRRSGGDPDGPAGWLFFAVIKAGFWAPEEHVHEGWEEKHHPPRRPADAHGGTRGHDADSQPSRTPPATGTGPMTSKGGALMLIHTDEPQTYQARESSVPEHVLRDYLESAPW